MAENWENKDYSRKDNQQPGQGYNPNAYTWNPQQQYAPQQGYGAQNPNQQYNPYAQQGQGYAQFQGQQQQQQYYSNTGFSQPSFGQNVYQPPGNIHSQQVNQMGQSQQFQNQVPSAFAPKPPVILKKPVDRPSISDQFKNAPKKTISLSSKPVSKPKEESITEAVSVQAAVVEDSAADGVNEKSDDVENDEEEEEVKVLDTPVVVKKDLPPADSREHLNIVFIGHVDAGKSTLSGSILYTMGSVDERTIEKFKKEAKETNRESWFLAFIMDTNEEERARGKTVEVGRAHFATEVKRYTILDAPGHKNYVPAMITGASQADVGILVISARKGEFEAGFDRLGQTREHAMLAKTLGVQKLVVVINKMDESTVKWNKARYDQCVKNLTPFLKQCGFKIKKHVTFLPISALSQENIREPCTVDWVKELKQPHSNKPLLTVLDELQMLGRDVDAPLRIPVIDRYTDRGVCVMGKVEAGYVMQGQTVRILPPDIECEVDSIFAFSSGETKGDDVEESEVGIARVGENVTVKLTKISEDDIAKGFVICGPEKVLTPTRTFVAQLQLLELLPHRSVFTAGYKCVLHAHTAIDEISIMMLLKQMDPKTGKPQDGKPRFVKSGAVVWCRIKCASYLCVEPFKDMMPLGRFTLRDEGKTIAIGKVVKIDAPKQ